MVDTVHGFQGDERDVIFFSPVVSAGIGESTLRFLKNHGNLFNVAITRARSELVVVGDRQAALDSGVSYLAGFAEYSRDCVARSACVPADRRDWVRSTRWWRIRSWFPNGSGSSTGPCTARACVRFRNTRKRPTRSISRSSTGERKLDIEVDGENYHRNWDGELCRRDQIRSRRLRDLGWDIMRFWVYELRDD